MANRILTGVRRFVIVRSSLSAALVVAGLSWGCRDAQSPTAVSGLMAGQRHSLSSAAPEAELIPGQYIITFVDSVKDVPGLAKRIAAQYGKEPLFTYTAAIKGFAVQLPDQAVEGLSHNTQIERIEQDAVVTLNDTQLNPPSWGLDRIDQRSSTLDYSYTYSIAGAGVSVYIIDSGIRSTHVDFGGRASGAYTAINDGYGTNDCIGHGTHVAGTVGSRTYGVSKAVTLYALRVLGCDGTGATSGVVSAVDWVTKNRHLPAVANMSLGTSSSSTLSQAVQSSIASGVVYVVAAGNSSVDACTVTPANVGPAITVGASNQYGWAESYSNYGSCVDLYAPGRAIISTWYTSDTAHTSMTGTSMASPHVAGAAALVLSANPTASPADVATAIVNSATVGALSSVAAGTPNLLLYTGFVSGTPAVDSTTQPISPTPSTDSPPVASFTSSCPKGTCTDDASASTDDFGIVGYAWDFGDGTTAALAASQKIVSHTYHATGSFVVRLTVTDKSGQRGTVTRTVAIKHAG
jgi:subtilisin family serine protease